MKKCARTWGATFRSVEEIAGATDEQRNLAHQVTQMIETLTHSQSVSAARCWVCGSMMYWGIIDVPMKELVEDAAAGPGDLLQLLGLPHKSSRDVQAFVIRMPSGMIAFLIEQIVDVINMSIPLSRGACLCFAKARIYTGPASGTGYAFE